MSKLSTQEFIARYQGYLKKRYDNDIKRHNQVVGTSYEYFEEILPAQVEHTHVLFPPEIQEDTGVARIYSPWGEYKKTLPPRYIRSYSLDMVYQKFMNERFEGDIARYNRAFGTAYKYFSQVEFPYTEPDTEDAKRAWLEFLRKRLPLRIVELTGGDEIYQRYLEEKYQTIEKYNAVYKETEKSFREITLPRTIPAGEVKTIDWVRFVDDVLPKEYVRVNSTERLFQVFLKDRYNDNINDLNNAYGTAYSNFSEIKPFYKEADYYDLYTHYREIKNKFISGNYNTVIKFILMKNKAVTNTFILVMATVVTQLTIQPLAAYALSRFKLSYGHWILLFFLATMAFPAEVAMIPNFLLIKELRLLNTYWALILPGMASGMGIFLLKGFFDSLPMELYESASIDGASELRIFWNITLPLSKPILAVIALGAFGSAYGGFLWAFLICQKPSMWTIMVFLYQFQMKNTQSVVMASLVITAIPTLLVFIFCQKIILRGIIIPTMK
jgi:multiple sugar transport system permease protein